VEFNVPIYEYACPHCRKTFEEWLKADDAAATHACPTCGESSPRVISNTTFILKGGGWYVTEYGEHKTEDGAAEASSNTDTAEDNTASGTEKPAASSLQTDSVAPAPSVNPGGTV
jgi:putative FmdB family regulatory protein